MGGFSYQLQELDLEAAANSDVDLLIVDYAADGSQQTRYSRRQVRQLQQKPDGGRRLVLAYLSLGEAEDYRFYWPGRSKAKAAGWLASKNSDWKGHYRVRFWSPAWREIVHAYLDSIVEVGFDGVYLDRVDVYKEIRTNSGSDTKELMIDLVCEMADRGRLLGGSDFGIFVQNAEELLKEERYLQTITGIGREEVYFAHSRGRRGVPQPNSTYVEEALDSALAEGKLVLSVDYPKNTTQTHLARRRAQSRGYLHFAGVRALDTLHGFQAQKSGRRSSSR